MDNDDLTIPEFLRRAPLTPGATRPPAVEAPIVATLKPEDALRYARKRRRRLRAEVRTLADDLDMIRVAHAAGRAGKELVSDAESKWRNAYAELALMED